MYLTSPPSSHSWPLWVNVFFTPFLLAIVFGKQGADPVMLLLFEVLILGANLLGVLVALWQRKWAVAAWYGLALVVMTACILLAFKLIAMPLET
jgi:hypothetical protein